MRAWWILLATGCWTAPARGVVEPAPRPASAPLGTCTLVDHFEEKIGDKVEPLFPMKGVQLAIDGEVFARPPSPTNLELQIGATKLARARVETSAVVLAGELDLGLFAVRPRDPAPREGWLIVNTATAQGAKGALAHVTVHLPKGLTPRTADLDVPCGELTSIAGDGDDVPAGDPVVLARGAHLLDTPAGTRIARVVEDALEASWIEREGDKVQVVIRGEDSTVVAWAADSDVTTPQTGGGGRGWGTIGTGTYGTTRMVSCSRDLDIYARSTKRGAVRVGHLKAGQSLKMNVMLSGPDETALDLGGDIAAYVRVSDLASC